MTTSYNNWEASPDLDVRDFTVAGCDFPAGLVDDDDVHTVFAWLVEQFDQRVEVLVDGWNWGYNYRLTTGGTTLSNHASGTALDLNAPLHPYGVAASANFDPGEVAEIRSILGVLDGLVAWGGDYDNPDAMHFELANHDLDHLARVADKIRGDDMADEATQNKLDRILAAAEAGATAAKSTAKQLATFRGTEHQRNLADIERDQRLRDALDALEAGVGDTATRKQVANIKKLLAAEPDEA